MTALAGEVLHLRVGLDPVAPWLGVAPLKRAQLTAGMLHAVETALAEAYENMPLGSQIVPFPESEDVDLAKLGREFRGSAWASVLSARIRDRSRPQGGPAAGAGLAPVRPHARSGSKARMTREALDGIAREVDLLRPSASCPPCCLQRQPGRSSARPNDTWRNGSSSPSPRRWPKRQRQSSARRSTWTSCSRSKRMTREGVPARRQASSRRSRRRKRPEWTLTQHWVWSDGRQKG